MDASGQTATGVRGASGATVRRQSVASASSANCAGVSIIPPSTTGRPDELAGLQPLGDQAQAGPVPIQAFQVISPPAAEQEQAAAERVGPQHVCHPRGQAVEAVARADGTEGQVHLGARRHGDHGAARSTASTRRSVRSLTNASPRSRVPHARSILVVPGWSSSAAPDEACLPSCRMAASRAGPAASAGASAHSCHLPRLRPEKSPVGKLLAVPRDGKPVVKFLHEDEAFLQVAEARRGYLGLRASAVSGRGPAMPSAMATQSAGGLQTLSSASSGDSPGSSNSRLRKTFTDADRHIPQEEGFGFVSRYFEGSLTELQARNPGL